VLADAAEAGTVSAFAAAQYAGIVREKEPTGNGSRNAARTNAWRIHQVLRAMESGELEAKPLAADEAPPRPEPAHALTPGGYGSLPCMTCSSATAVLARQEIADVYLANQMGDGSRRSNPYGTLPRACCRRGAAVLTAAALIG
jgi:hypothetical protein